MVKFNRYPNKESGVAELGVDSIRARRGELVLWRLEVINGAREEVGFVGKTKSRLYVSGFSSYEGIIRWSRTTVVF